MYTDPNGQSHAYGPPANWVQPATQNVGPADWDALVATGLQFEPYRGNDTLVRIARGTCLSPLITAGDMLTVRPVADGETLIDGGLYCIRWNNEAEVQAYRDVMNLPATEPIVITKVLRFVGGEWWCQCNESLARLDGIVVMMVVGCVSRRVPGEEFCSPEVHARQLAPCDVDAAQLGQNAATVTYLATNNFAGITASGTTGKTNTNISFVIGAGTPYACTVIVTVVVACHQSAGSGSIKIMIGYDDAGGTSYIWSVPEVLVTASSAIYTLQYQFAHLVGNTVAPRVVLGWDSSSATNVLTADGYETFQSEYIVR